MVAKYKTFHFSPNDPINIDMSDEDIDSLFEYSKERWNNCLRSFLATEVSIVKENGVQPIHTASRSTNHHDRGIYSTAAKKYMHRCSAYINQGHAKDQHACAAVNISKKKHFGVNSTDQQFLDGFKLNLGILDDLEGGADDFGIMATFHSLNNVRMYIWCQSMAFAVVQYMPIIPSERQWRSVVSISCLK